MPSSLDSIADRIRRHPKLVIADDFEIALEKSNSKGIRYHNGELRTQTETDRLWVSLRILHRKRGGKAVFLNPTEESVGFLVEAAFESANRSAVDPWFRFPIWKTPKSPAPNLEAADETYRYDSLYSRTPLTDAAFDEAYETHRVETLLRRKTERIEFKHTRPMHFASFSLITRPTSDFVVFEEEHGARTPLRQRTAWLEEMTRSAQTRTKGESKPCGRGKRRVVLAPRVAVRFLRLLAPWFCADLVQSGRSPLSSALGQTVLPGCMTLCDDGNHPESPWAIPFDMEGVATQRTVLVDKGEIRSWLYDVYHATRENRLSTGNRFKTEADMASRIAPSTLYCQAGELSHQGILEKMGQGVYLDTLESLTQVSGEKHRFIAKGAGWRVAFGHLAEPLSDIIFEFDPLQLMSSSGAVGRDLSFFGSYGSPSILLEDLPLGI